MPLTLWMLHKQLSPIRHHKHDQSHAQTNTHTHTHLGATTGTGLVHSWVIRCGFVHFFLTVLLRLIIYFRVWNSTLVCWTTKNSFSVAVWRTATSSGHTASAQSPKWIPFPVHFLSHPVDGMTQTVSLIKMTSLGLNIVGNIWTM